MTNSKPKHTTNITPRPRGPRLELARTTLRTLTKSELAAIVAAGATNSRGCEPL